MNVNKGQTIYVRLRHHSNAQSMIDFEAVVDTMLHELAHMEVSV